LPYAPVVFVVEVVAPQRSAVSAGGFVAAGAAGLQGAAAAGDAVVDDPERWCGEGGEHGRMPGDGGGDAFAAGEAGFDELVGVPAVDLGAGGAE
jgi:hypothetical protein